MMFNWNNNQPKGSAKKAYPKEVLEIHKEFDTAGQKLLEEAQEIILKSESSTIDKAKRLISLGFKQTKEAAEGDRIIKQSAASKEVLKLVRHYRSRYPNNKFISDEQVKAICYKYNLVCGGVSRFKGFVPEKNLLQIEQFKLKEGDIFNTNESIYFVTTHDSTYDWHLSDIKEQDIKTRANVSYLKGSSHYVEFMCPTKNNGRGKIVSHFANPDLLSEICGLKICAPVKDMDLNGLTVEDGYKLKSEIHVPDPVVLQPVHGGYLIVTAWGDEASDELVVNQNHN